MKIFCAGTDPAGLMAALLLKRQDTSRIVRIVPGADQTAPAALHIG